MTSSFPMVPFAPACIEPNAFQVSNKIQKLRFFPAKPCIQKHILLQIFNSTSVSSKLLESFARLCGADYIKTSPLLQDTVIPSNSTPFPPEKNVVEICNTSEAVARIIIR
jgi:hypothetical protein